MRAAPRGTLYPAPILAPKNRLYVCFHVENYYHIHGLVHGSYIRRERNYDNLLTDVVQIGI